MKKYRLKNRELQQKLDALTDGEFTTKLELVPCGPSACDIRLYLCYVPGREASRLQVDFWANEIETFDAYAPNEWNNFPEIDPPEGVFMQLEVFRPANPERGEEICLRACGAFDGSRWQYQGSAIPVFTGQKLRFKAWG